MHVCVWECLLVFLMLWGHLFTKSHCEDSFPFLDAKATHLKITLKISPGLMLGLVVMAVQTSTRELSIMF